MKRMILALVAAIIGLSAHAAALNWGSGGYGSGGTSLAGASAYLVQVTDSANFAIADSLEITGGSVFASATIQSSGLVNGNIEVTNFTHGNTYEFVIVLTTEGVPGLTLPTTGSYAVDYNGGNSGTYYSMVWDSSTGGTISPDWTVFTGIEVATKVVPEPTVLALLALGVAGLALKRKVA